MSIEPAVPMPTHLMRVQVRVEPPRIIGEGPLGVRKYIAITGGEFEGEELQGEVLPGGGDWLLERPDGTVQLDARYVLSTRGGQLIYVRDQGYRHGPADVMQRLALGELVDPADYYFRTSTCLETAGEYDWLNRTVVVGSGARNSDGVVIDFYQLG